MFYITSISLQLQHWYCSNISALLRSINVLKHLSNRSSHVAAITSHISLFRQKLQQNQCKKPLHYSFPAGAYAASSHQIPSSVIPNKGFLTSRPVWGRTHKTTVPNISFHCAFFLCKSLESLAKISPHNLGRAFCSPGRVSTATNLSEP